MRNISVELQNQVVQGPGGYDQSKATIYGRVAQKMIDGGNVLGCPTAGFIDDFTDSGSLVPVGSMHVSPNGRKFTIVGLTTGVCTIQLHTFDLATGAYVLVGKLAFAVPNVAATVHTTRGLVVLDAGTTNWKLYLVTTGSILPNGGVFLVNGVGLADFTPVLQPTIPFATGNNQRAVYMLRNPLGLQTQACTISVAAPGKVTLNSHGFMANDPLVFSFGTVPTGLVIGTTYFVKNPTANDFEVAAAVGGISIATTGAPGSSCVSLVPIITAATGVVPDRTNNKLCVHNGLAAAHQYHVFNTAAAPTYTTTTGITVTVAAPGKVQLAAHGLAVNDQWIFTAGTLPTGLALNTVYFVRNPSLNDFELSATSGGVSITTTGVAGLADGGRAHGVTGSQFLLKTNNLPALAGVLLLNDSEKYATPAAGHLNLGVIGGLPCAFFATTTNLYLGLLSELTSGAVAWPSLTTANMLGAVNEIVTPTAAYAAWDNILDAAVIIATTSNKVIIKKVVNNALVSQHSGVAIDYYEGVVTPTVSDFGLLTIYTMVVRDGWLFVGGASVGQRGTYFMSTVDDSGYNGSYIITKVLSLPNSVLRTFDTLEKLYDITGDVRLEYRTSGFGVPTGGWTYIPHGEFESIALSGQVQFKVSFVVQGGGYAMGAQMVDILLAVEDNAEISEYWEYSQTESSNGVPTRATFRQKKVYSVAPAAKYFRAYDLSNSLLTNHNTSANAANFTYSTDNGTTYLPLGVVPNVVGTLLRYEFTSPPGVDIRVGLKES